MSSTDDLAGAFEARVERLHARLSALGELVVAFSGGVDSTVLLHAARRALGARAVALVADSPSLPRRELAEARALARHLGARLVELRTDELDDPDYVANAGRRCYHCKRALFRAMAAWARAHGHAHLAFGEIVDDLADDRPGADAARELGVHAPLSAASLSKADVRRYARQHGLPVADKPASACLASRIPVGTPVSAARLARVERAEEAVRGLGFRVLRVRDRGEGARLEVGADELGRARAARERLAAALAREGFDALELAAYVPPGRSKVVNHQGRASALPSSHEGRPQRPSRRSPAMVQNPPQRTQRVIPYLVYKDAPAAIEFLCRAFGFEERLRMPAPDGDLMHAELQLGDSVVMLATACEQFGHKVPLDLPGSPHAVMCYVDDVDAHYARARESGATITDELADKFYGDRMYAATDPEGHRWYFSTHVRDVPQDEMEKAMREMFEAHGG